MQAEKSTWHLLGTGTEGGAQYSNAERKIFAVWLFHAILLAFTRQSMVGGNFMKVCMSYMSAPNIPFESCATSWRQTRAKSDLVLSMNLIKSRWNKAFGQSREIMHPASCQRQTTLVVMEY
ncbi:hypothetical protein CSKR_202528 [Clonorchis sinensis]|uniref:Uncharacterized protein n=1 Tax=Clonorchis sinensis TaxID=79923 RepID=A0A8T1MXL2_CLOSI|nr:hypothetical protein CSKR_202528 [Clonorchis sinensis]